MWLLYPVGYWAWVWRLNGNHGVLSYWCSWCWEPASTRGNQNKIGLYGGKGPQKLYHRVYEAYNLATLINTSHWGTLNEFWLAILFEVMKLQWLEGVVSVSRIVKCSGTTRGMGLQFSPAIIADNSPTLVWELNHCHSSHSFLTLSQWNSVYLWCAGRLINLHKRAFTIPQFWRNSWTFPIATWSLLCSVAAYTKRASILVFILSPLIFALLKAISCLLHTPLSVCI